MVDRQGKLDEALSALQERGLDPESPGGAVALQFLLGNTAIDRQERTAPETAPSSGTTAPESTRTNDDPIGAFAEWSGTDPLRLADFFEVNDGAIRLTIPSGRLPRAKADQQRILTLLTLAADRVALKAPQTSYREINAVLHDYAVFDQNLGKNVAKNSNLVIRSGKPKAYVYRITQPGLDRARELIQILTTNDEALPS